MIRDIRKQARSLNELIDNILEISRIDSGLIAQEGQVLNLVQLARDELERQQSLAQEKSHRMQLLADEPVGVLGHKDRLQRVIRNLLHNAIKYTPSGGQITCECRVNHVGAVALAEWPGSADLPPGQWAALRVVDTGIGISPENLPHLFERFYRVEPQGYIPGTGLGLAIVKELVEWHEGRLGVSSTPGQGSTFAIYLPLEAGSHKG